MMPAAKRRAAVKVDKESLEIPILFVLNALTPKEADGRLTLTTGLLRALHAGDLTTRDIMMYLGTHFDIRDSSDISDRAIRDRWHIIYDDALPNHLRGTALYQLLRLAIAEDFAETIADMINYGRIKRDTDIRDRRGLTRVILSLADKGYPFKGLVTVEPGVDYNPVGGYKL